MSRDGANITAHGQAPGLASGLSRRNSRAVARPLEASSGPCACASGALAALCSQRYMPPALLLSRSVHEELPWLAVSLHRVPLVVMREPVCTAPVVGLRPLRHACGPFTLGTGATKSGAISATCHRFVTQQERLGSTNICRCRCFWHRKRRRGFLASYLAAMVPGYCAMSRPKFP